MACLEIEESAEGWFLNGEMLGTLLDDLMTFFSSFMVLVVFFSLKSTRRVCLDVALLLGNES